MRSYYVKDYSPSGLHKFRLYIEETTSTHKDVRRVTVPDKVWKKFDNYIHVLISACRTLVRRVL